MEEIVAIVLKAFGAAGGLAVLLLAASIWANWKLVLRLSKQHDSISEIEKSHIKEMAECQVACEKEKVLYRESVDRHYKEAVITFLERDNQKREDIDTMFKRFETLVAVISDGLTRVTDANNNLRYDLKGLKGSS